uniref:Uncharacterized protein n=1 Tax=Anguilla anguilla TaxID=7936 RepID=A0A0E9QP90_ANGAN
MAKCNSLSIPLFIAKASTIWCKYSM